MKKENLIKLGTIATLAIAGMVILNGCSVKVPTNVTAVNDFDVNKYAGKWYEIARFDFKYEKNMSNVTAEYTLNDDGSIQVVNKGYNYEKNEWKTSKGKAKINNKENNGALKVSFFGPFYSGYNVVAMDPAYETALVFGESTDYLWILSREIGRAHV